MSPAFTLHTPRLQLRAFDPADAEAMCRTVVEHRQHLVRYMDFALRTPTVDDYVELMLAFRQRFLQGDFAFSIWREGSLIGGCGLHPKVGAGGLEAGYWLAADACGHGFAGEALAALCRVAFSQQQVDRVVLFIEPSNEASLRVAQRAGFVHEATLRRRIPFGDDYRDAEVYTLFADDYELSPCSELEVQRFDAAGRPAPWTTSRAT